MAVVSGAAGAGRELRRFEAQRSAAVVELRSAPPDTTYWSAKRVREWRESYAREAPPPLAVLRIPRIALEVAILEGTDDWTLNRAVGHIEDTPVPGAGGNVGIAGHRDGFFRGLKDIAPGDRLEIETLTHIERYRVDRVWIVSPEEVSVLEVTDTPSITLVTCYPFYFIGSAPQRYIVRAVREESEVRKSS